jgi:hypothetical protein
MPSLDNHCKELEFHVNYIQLLISNYISLTERMHYNIVILYTKFIIEHENFAYMIRCCEDITAGFSSICT